MKCFLLWFLSFAIMFASPFTANAAYGLLNPIPAPQGAAEAESQLGSSVAVEGSYAVVGAPFEDTGGTNSGVVRIFNSDTGALLLTLSHPSPGVDRAFGRAVSISGTRLLVGAPGSNPGSYAGICYLYDLAGQTPTVPVQTFDNPTPAGLDLFGFSVSISGDRVVIGTPRDDTVSGDAGAVYVYDLSGDTPTTPTHTLLNPGSGADYFGWSVGTSGNFVAVSAVRDNEGASQAGKVYAFDLSSQTPGTPVATLANPAPAQNNHFGRSISLSGSRLLVGAWQDDTGAGNAGRAYLYDLTGETPTTPFSISNPAPASGDRFGQSVSISGNLAVVGAFQDDANANDAGTAYVFDLTSQTPATPIRVLDNPAPAVSDEFGSAVAISGNRVLIGAPLDEAGAENAGSAFVYDLASGSPTLPVATLAAAGAIHFGSAVAISGSLVAVGAPNDDTGAGNSGAVYVYDRSSGTPAIPVYSLANPTPALMDAFGGDLALSGQLLVVGAHGDDTGADNAGSVYVYDLAGTTPSQPLLAINNPDPGAMDAFGMSVAISGSLIAVGAPLDDTSAANAGSVYVYDLSGGNPSVPIAIIPNPAPAANDLFGASVALSGARLVVGAYGDDAAGPDTGTAYVFDLSSGLPTGPAFTLLNPNPVADDQFGISTAISGTRVVIGAPGRDLGVSGAGSVFVYDLAGASPTTPLVTLENPNPAADDGFGARVGISDNRVAIGVPYSDSGATDAGMVHVYDLTSGTPAVPVDSLSNPAPDSRDAFGASVAVEGYDVAVGASMDDTLAPDQGYAYVFGSPDPGVISIDGSLFVVSESAGVVNIPLIRTDGAGGIVSVTVVTTDGTAKVGSDFEALSPSSKIITFGDGVTEMMVPITLTTPDAAEPNEFFTVTISNPTSSASLGTVVSARVVIVDGATDTAKPTVSITTPSANAKISDASGPAVMVTGKASDNKGVTKVQVRFKGGEFEDAAISENELGNPTVTFSRMVSPALGTHTLEVRSIDHAGNISSIVSRTFTFFALRDLVVAIDGPADSGAVSKGFLGTSTRQVGVSYSITATAKKMPAPGFMFAGWTIGGGLTAEDIGVTNAALELPTLKFVFREGLTLTAKFIPYPFTAAVVGSFNGLVLPSPTLPVPGTLASHETVGMITATIATTGAISGKVFIDGLTLNFAGKLDKDGAIYFGDLRSLIAVLTRVTKPSFELALQVDLDPAGTGKLTGTLTQKYRSAVRSVCVIDADRAYYGAQGPKVPENLAGAGSKNYTAVLPAKEAQPPPLTTADYPQGHGFANVTVKTNGLVSVAGRLADGATLTASVPLSKANTWPLFQQLYKLGSTGRGCIAGMVTVNDTQGETDMFGANLYWFRPFQLVQWYPYGWEEGVFVDFAAAKYDIPAAASVFPGVGAVDATSGNAEVTFSGGLLDDDIILAANVNSANAVTKPADNTDANFTLKIAAPTGLINGAFTHSDGTKPPFLGIIYQKGAKAGAYGYFLSTSPKVLDYMGEGGKVEMFAK